MKLQGFITAFFVALIVTGVFAMPQFERMRGLSIDLLFLLRQTVFFSSTEKIQSHSVVVAIDEETYRRKPFQDTPKTMWTPQTGEIINKLVEGGAKVIGFDIIFPTSVGKYIRGYDRPLLIALKKASREGKVVLGKVQHQMNPILPHRMQRFAVGHHKNIRTTNVFEDPDGIIRKVPLIFQSINKKTGKTAPEPSLALELVKRVTGEENLNWKKGAISIDGSVVPGSSNGKLTLNFSNKLQDIPTYSFADLYRCAQEGKSSYFKENFRDKVVLFGVVLDVEDRKITSNRFITGPEEQNTARCSLPKLEGVFRKDIVRDAIPGVYIHATAVNNLLNGNALQAISPLNGWVVSIFFTVVISIISLMLSPIITSAILLTLTVAWAAFATIIFNGGLVLPLLDPLLGSLISFGIMLAYKFTVADKDKRFLRKSFQYYLSPSVIDQMVEGDEPPSLGGETRNISIFFSDIANFTSISEALSPLDLVTFLNTYLTEMTNIVEKHGGFVDKYIGDAIVGVFGAPLADPLHAEKAVNAALECQLRLKTIQNELSLPISGEVTARIGINSGEALVGNIGSNRRFNYTVIGDTVNLAARLEGANKAYKTDILISEETRKMCGDGIIFREVDQVRVVGRDKPVVIYEPFILNGFQNRFPFLDFETYSQALKNYRDGNFTGALTSFSNLGQLGDKVAEQMASRTKHLLEDETIENWSGVTDLDAK